jgi:ABC-type lipoprotein export system ATPase subunit
MPLTIKNLCVTADNKEIIKDFNLELHKGQVIALMGPNGSGKSTFANALMGHPKYHIDQGSIILDGIDITVVSPDKRAKLGLFLSMQYPPEINGVTLAHFLRLAKQATTGTKIDPMNFHNELIGKMTELHIDSQFLKRYLNTGFSGGEKKKAEILQLSVLDPTFTPSIRTAMYRGHNFLAETFTGTDGSAFLPFNTEGFHVHGAFKIADASRAIPTIPIASTRFDVTSTSITTSDDSPSASASGVPALSFMSGIATPRSKISRSACGNASKRPISFAAQIIPSLFTPRISAGVSSTKSPSPCQRTFAPTRATATH